MFTYLLTKCVTHIINGGCMSINHDPPIRHSSSDGRRYNSKTTLAKLRGFRGGAIKRQPNDQ